ncbi:hypothetical protein WKI33_12355 [Curtobacterium citreum]
MYVVERRMKVPDQCLFIVTGVNQRDPGDREIREHPSRQSLLPGLIQPELGWTLPGADYEAGAEVQLFGQQRGQAAPQCGTTGTPQMIVHEPIRQRLSVGLADVRGNVGINRRK